MNCQATKPKALLRCILTALKARNKDSGNFTPANDNDLYSLRYSEFVVPLVKAVQEQQQEIADLKKLVERLQNQLAK